MSDEKARREHWRYLIKRDWLNDPKNWQECDRPLTPAEVDFMAAVLRNSVSEHLYERS